MLDTSAYRVNEMNGKRAIADWRLSNINDPYIFQNQGFPVRVDSFLDLAQILDTMQEDRFDYYMKEIGGFTDEDLSFFIGACLDYVDFYHSTFQRDRVLLPLSTLIAHFVLYKKLCGYSPQFSRLLEIGPGCGYLSFFLRSHRSLFDYTQIELTESFYLLQSHINSHVFGTHFDEHALSKYSPDDGGAYHPKLKWHDQFHYEEQKIIKLCRNTICNHYPWWRIGEVANRKYEIVSSNANLNEFSREALFQYLSLIHDVLADDGVIVAQCLGGGAPTYDTIFSNMKSAGFVPVALAWVDNVPGRIFVVANGIFVSEKHPLYSKYVDRKPSFPILDRELEFVNKMYFINEERSEHKTIYSTAEILSAISDRFNQTTTERDTEAHVMRSPSQNVTSIDVKGNGSLISCVQPTEAAAELSGLVKSKGHTAEIDRLKRVARKEALQSNSRTYPILDSKLSSSAEVDALRRTLVTLRASKSWRLTAPLRKIVRFVRNPTADLSADDDARIDLITNPHQLVNEIKQLQLSTSWRITAPLRSAKQWIARR